MKLIYVAGPYRAKNQLGGQDMFAVQQNIMRAMAVGLEVAKLGAAFHVPHANSMFFTGAAGLPDSVWLNCALESMRRCDAVVLVDGWNTSAGTLAEITEARRLGIPVMQIHALEGWLEDQSAREAHS